MITRTWQFKIGDTQHEVRLEHHRLRRQIWVDGELAVDERPFVSSSMPLVVDGCKCVLAAAFTGEYEYALWVDERLVPALEDSGQNAAARNHLYWLQLAEKMAFEKVVADVDGEPLGPFLIGEIDGFLSMVYSRMSRDNVPLVNCMLQFAPLENPGQTAEEIRNAFAAEGIVRGRGWINGVLVRGEFVLIQFLDDPERLSVEQFVDCVRDAAAILANYVSRVARDACEARSCPQRTGVELKIVLFNGVPHRLCNACISDLKTAAEQAGEIREIYDDSFSFLGAGIRAGLLAAVAGSLLWAAIDLLSNWLEPISMLAVLAGIIWAMRRAGAKPTLLSATVAGILGCLSSIAGACLGLLPSVLRDSGLPVQFFLASPSRLMDLLGRIWSVLWDASLSSSFPLGLAWGAGICLLLVVAIRQEDEREQSFRTDIRVLAMEP